MEFSLPQRSVTGLFQTYLPDGGHSKVQLHKDGAKRQEASCSKEDIGVAGPVGWGYMPGDLVGPSGVGDDGLLSCNHSTCKQAACSQRPS